MCVTQVCMCGCVGVDVDVRGCVDDVHDFLEGEVGCVSEGELVEGPNACVDVTGKNEGSFVAMLVHKNRQGIPEACRVVRSRGGVRRGVVAGT